MSRTITLSSPAMPYLLGEPALILKEFDGEEAFSTLYTYTLTVKTPANPNIPWQTASNVDLKALIGKEMTVHIELDGNGLDFKRGLGKGQREISGLVEKARYIGFDANQAMFEIVLRPWFYLTTLTTDYKIFQKKNVVDIIEEVLGDYPFPFEKRLSASYPQLDFQVQYGESDFDFIERLMEEWGIYWFFEHSDQKHKLILVDHVGAHKAYSSEAYRTINYVPDKPKAGEEYIKAFHHQEMITSGRWVTNDYDFTKSRANIIALDDKPRKTSFNDSELYHWPGDYEQPAMGEQLARIRIEERGALGSRASAEGELRGIVCGTNFELKGYPVDKVNREYMVISSALKITEVEQLTGDTVEFSVKSKFTVQPTTKIYRHPQVIPKPRTSGPQNAIVVGPPGEEVWTDEYGRVKVRFTWDRYGKNRETDSCWLRVSQAWAGNSFGGIYIPRIGHEVIVDFINGDPDRPMIMGSLYNNVTLPPWDLPVNATQSGMISRTIKGGKNQYNGVRFEDKPGLEQYWEQAERDMSRLTKRNEEQTIGVNSKINVGFNRNVVIGGNYSDSVTLTYTSVVGGLYSTSIGGANVVNIAGARNMNIGGAKVTSIGGAMTYSIGGANALNIGGANMTNVGGADMTSVGGYHSVVAGGAWQATAGGAATLFGGGAVAVGAGGELLLTGNVVKIIGKSKVIIQGGEVHLNPGDCGECCGSGGGGGGGGAVGLTGLAGLPGLAGIIALPLPLPCLPIIVLPPIVLPPLPEVTTPAPTTPEPTTPEPTTPEPTTPEPTTPEPTTPEPTTPEPTATIIPPRRPPLETMTPPPLPTITPE